MPRKSRNSIAGIINHVIVQGIEKKYIFNNERYILKYKNVLKEKLIDSNIKILAYCIMNNHAHLLIYSEKIEDLSKYMHKVNTSYAKFYNDNNSRVGHLFRDRYYSQLIKDDVQLYNCINYIHNNPIKANICKNMQDYKFSSFNEFINLNKDGLISEESIELIFNRKDYMSNFLEINKYNIDDSFYDISEKSIEEFINEIEEKYRMKLSNIINDNDKCLQFLKDARKETTVTILELSKIVGKPVSTIARKLKK